MAEKKLCIDCADEGFPGQTIKRPVPHPGPRCTTHHRLAVKKRKSRSADARRAQTYGLTGGTYRQLLELQGGACGVCGRTPKPGGRRLAVDHDHSCCPGPKSCGRCVRGLLCWSCNKFLHHISDELDKVEAMAAYLRDWPSWKLNDRDPREGVIRPPFMVAPDPDDLYER